MRSQAVRSLSLRHTRYFGLPKTALSHLFTAAALNLIRLDAFPESKKVTKTRVSHFAALAPVELEGLLTVSSNHYLWSCGVVRSQSV